jgi:hypothetical protein
MRGLNRGETSAREAVPGVISALIRPFKNPAVPVSMSDKDIGPEETSTEASAPNQINKIAKMFVHFIRLVSFRGDPHSITGLEALSLDDVTAAG